jgi:hypothetical protein
MNRMLAYYITYSNFKRRLLTDGNLISTGGDLVGLALTGLAATTGSAATKSAPICFTTAHCPQLSPKWTPHG